MIHLFCGYDHREAIGFHVFAQSVIDRATGPVAMIPLSSMGMAQGSNAFTLSRFLIPYLMGFKGRAIFADASDMLMLGDVAELDSMFHSEFAVQVVKHPDYQTRHKTKYRGTDMECPNLDYPRKNWASLMLINCEHPAWRMLTPQTMPNGAMSLLQFDHIPDEAIGELPDCWNRLADEGHRADGAKLLHWTAGGPAFEQYRDAPAAGQWYATRATMEAVY